MDRNFKINQIINTLSDTEIRQIRKMLKSPFFTRRSDLPRLFETLLKSRKKKRTKISAEWIFQQVFPDKSWDYQLLRGTMSDLIEIIEECWMINYWRSDQIKNKLILSKIYRRRNLDKSFSSSIKKSQKLLENQVRRNADYYQDLLLSQTEQMKYRSSTKRTEDLFLQEISDTTDILYLIEKLQTACAQLSHQLVRKTSYDYGLLSNLVKEISQEKYLKIPAIAIYYYCFRFLTEKDNLEYFNQFKILLNNYRHHFTQKDLEAPFRLAINLCIRKTNEGVESFVRDSWELYKEGLKEGILLENNFIPRFTFSNAISAALRLKEFDWVDSFINNSAHQLEETFREQTISLNLARLEFDRKNYEKSLTHLRSAEYKDLMNNMFTKILLVKIYFELNEFDSLQSHLDSFQQFIRRNAVSDYHKTNILNLVRFSRKIIALAKYDTAEKSKLHNQIKTEAILSEKEWLLEKL